MHNGNSNKTHIISGPINRLSQIKESEEPLANMYKGVVKRISKRASSAIFVIIPYEKMQIVGRTNHNATVMTNPRTVLIFGKKRFRRIVKRQ